MEIEKFNVRVYALLINNGKILIIREPFGGKLINKFPGGGLEFGEGTIDCLKREFVEELNLKIEVNTHFYTQDFFYPSAKPKEQILMIYYSVHATTSIDQLRIVDTNIDGLLWKDVSALTEDDLDLPTDKVVVRKLLEEITIKAVQINSDLQNIE